MLNAGLKMHGLGQLLFTDKLVMFNMSTSHCTSIKKMNVRNSNAE